MKSYEQLAIEGDHARQKACGWGSGAWVGIEFPEPRTKAEATALALIQEQFPNSVTVHVYTLVDLVADIIQKQWESDVHF